MFLLNTLALVSEAPEICLFILQLNHQEMFLFSFFAKHQVLVSFSFKCIQDTKMFLFPYTQAEPSHFCYHKEKDT